MVEDEFGDIFELLAVVPDLVEQLEEHRRDGHLVELGDHIRHGVATLVAEVCRGEAVKGLIRRAVVDDSELLHRSASPIRSKLNLLFDPLRALAGDCPLGQLVAKADFEL